LGDSCTWCKSITKVTSYFEGEKLTPGHSLSSPSPLDMARARHGQALSSPLRGEGG